MRLTLPAANSRADVGPHGFSVAAPAALFDGNTHTLSAIYGGTSSNIQNSPWVINPSAPATLSGYLDYASQNGIAGWTQDSSQPGTSLNVDLYDGITLFATVPTNLYRSDRVPGNHKFLVTLPAAMIDGMPHVVHARYGGTATELSNSPQTVLLAPTLTVPNSSFEVPALAAGAFASSGSNWTFTAGAGISANGGVFTGANANAPDGTQIAVLQGAGTISQPISGFVGGTGYVLTFAASQRANGNASTQTVQVSLDGQMLGAVTPGGPSYTDYPLYFTPSAGGTHTLTFTGTNPNGGDNTALIDSVRLAPASATAVGTADVTVSLSSSTTGLCAGGWSRATRAYQYYSLALGRYAPWTLPDPHVATLTAAVTDAGGRPLPGRAVTLTWAQPGLGQADDPPLVSFTGTTDARGQISTIAISGDVTGAVPVTASCGQAKATLTLNYQAAQAQWQYKDATGAWQMWAGDGADLYAAAAGVSDIQIVPLKVSLTYNSQPVAGHQMNWAIFQVLDKGSVPVLQSTAAPYQGQYVGYGHLTGSTSTTGASGDAANGYNLSFLQGQLTFEVIDNSVFIDGSGGSAGTNLSATRPSALPRYTPAKGHRRYARTTSFTDAYEYVKGDGNTQGHPELTPFAYPAPSGAEDDELISETLSILAQAMGIVYSQNPNYSVDFSFNGFSPGPMLAHLFPQTAESYTGSRFQPSDVYGSFPPNLQNGDWWISQGVGMDSSSRGLHIDDMIWHKKFYGAAFDLVLTGIPIYQDNRVLGSSGLTENPSNRSAFTPYVTALRGQGIVCWHRWVNEPGSFNENEIHCIDPAFPFIKSGLRTQIDNYLKQTTNAIHPDDIQITGPDAQRAQQRLDLRGTIKGTYSDALPTNGF